jgi:peroxiredoxin
LVGTSLLAACWGCRQQTSQQAESEPTGQTEANSSRSDPANNTPAHDNPGTVDPPVTLPATIPDVRMSEADRETCLVFVGDAMPEAELSDLGGQGHSLHGLFGKRLTVVCFWARGQSEYAALRAGDLLDFLAKDIAEPFAPKGVQVIGVNEGDSAEVVGQLIAQAGVTFPNLLDPQGALFAQVATEKTPRTYLLDAEGKILWLDLEYSMTSRRDLRTAIKVALGETAAEEE